ncbi:MAG TPA: hypothetical protein VII96_08980 [Acidimicrobiales bacterium]
MRSAPSWIRRGLLVALLAAVAVVVARALGSGGADGGLLPAIGGDTWPPVPVKDARPT